jgi:hypothetical protein
VVLCVELHIVLRQLKTLRTPGLEVCTARNFRILHGPTRRQFGPTQSELGYIVCATGPDPNPNIMQYPTRPEGEYYSCYLARPELEYYLCYPVIMPVNTSSSNYENPRENQVGETCSANLNEPNFPNSSRKTFTTYILSSSHLMYF